ncbi:MAG TPA: SAM-dependent methyltransferase [Thermoleophilaceae bacterium]
MTVSRTAQSVAALRATFDRPSTPGGDPDAQRRLARGMTPGRALELRDQLLERTTFFDRVVLDALARGVDQVVIVGAGYDDRALRFRSPGVRFFELDHPSTQADKRKRLEGTDGGPAFAPVDLVRESVAGALAAAGHSDARPTLFICEGVLVYLEPPDIVRMLAELASRAGDGSELAVSLAIHAPEYPTEAVLRVVNEARGDHAGEPWRTILPRDAHLDLLRRAGWVEQEVLGEERSLLVRVTVAE